MADMLAAALQGGGQPARETQSPNLLARALQGYKDYWRGIYNIPRAVGEVAKDAAYEAFIDIPQRAIRAGGVYGDPYASEAEKVQAAGDIFGAAAEWGAAGLAVPRPKNSIGMFGGINAKTADHKALARAQEMADAGMDRNDIWSETGWFKGVDDKWRFEIDDSEALLDDANFSHASSDLSELSWQEAQAPSVFSHHDLYSQYPDFRTAEIARVPTPHPDGLRGQYREPITFDSGLGDIPESITLWDGFGSDRSTILHEAQHGLQRREGFAAGGNPRGVTANELPRNPKYDAWNANQEVVQKARDYYESPEYKADLEHQNAYFREVWEPQYNEAEQGFGKLPDDEAMAAYNRVHDSMVADIAEKYPKLKWLEGVSREYGLDEPSATISPKDWYNRLAGEVEARNVQKRMDMTPDQRRATPPWETQDVPDDQQIVRIR